MDILTVVKSKHANSNTIIHCLYGHYFLGITNKALAKVFGKAESTISSWIHNWDTERRAGRLPPITTKFDDEMKAFVLEAYRKNPTWKI